MKNLLLALTFFISFNGAVAMYNDENGSRTSGRSSPPISRPDVESFVQLHPNLELRQAEEMVRRVIREALDNWTQVQETSTRTQETRHTPPSSTLITYGRHKKLEDSFRKKNAPLLEFLSLFDKKDSTRSLPFFIDVVAPLCIATLDSILNERLPLSSIAKESFIDGKALSAIFAVLWNTGYRISYRLGWHVLAGTNVVCLPEHNIRNAFITPHTTLDKHQRDRLFDGDLFFQKNGLEFILKGGTLLLLFVTNAKTCIEACTIVPYNPSFFMFMTLMLWFIDGEWDNYWWSNTKEMVEGSMRFVQIRDSAHLD